MKKKMYETPTVRLFMELQRNVLSDSNQLTGDDTFISDSKIF